MRRSDQKWDRFGEGPTVDLRLTDQQHVKVWHALGERHSAAGGSEVRRNLETCLNRYPNFFIWFVKLSLLGVDHGRGLNPVFNGNFGEVSGSFLPFRTQFLRKLTKGVEARSELVLLRIL
jgi:hypothetical protein